MKTVLVTGGAGYVGSHCCLKLRAAGFLPVTYDNLSTGYEAFVQFGPLETGDVRDHARLEAVIRQYRPSAVLHFAADIEVGPAEHTPGRCMHNNVGGTASLLAACEATGVDVLVFSSTCAIFGDTATGPLTETSPIAPISAYGLSKHVSETLIEACEARTGLRAARLRYFNASGADPLGRLGEAHEPETHLIPIVFEAALGLRSGLKIFGDDFDTPDGTAIRDYIHVLDLADAHVSALQRLLGGTGPGFALNLGTGTGYSVAQLVEEARQVCGQPIRTELAPRRPGDPARLVANPARARDMLGWSACHDLDAILRDAWMWHSTHRAKRLGQALAAE